MRLAIADLVVGWTLVAAGLAAWWRRPETRIGILLAVAGFSWFLGTFADSSIDGVAGFGAVFVTLHRGPLAHALLSYPTGRLEDRLERGVVAFAYLTAAIVDVGQNAIVTLVMAGAAVGMVPRRHLTPPRPLPQGRA